MSIKNFGIIAFIALSVIVIFHGSWNYGLSYRLSSENSEILKEGEKASMQAARATQSYRAEPVLNLLNEVQEQNKLKSGENLFVYGIDSAEQVLWISPNANELDVKSYQQIFAGGAEGQDAAAKEYRLNLKDSLVEMENTLLFKIIEFGIKD